MEFEMAYRTYRPLLFSIAYRMLGSVTNAEDVVQDAFLTMRLREIHEDSHVHNLKAYLCKIITNKCLDYLKSARKKESFMWGHGSQSLSCKIMQSLKVRNMSGYRIP